MSKFLILLFLFSFSLPFSYGKVIEHKISDDDLPCGGAPGVFHTNPDSSPGGFIADSASVETLTVFIGPDASVCERASLFGNARVEDFAVIAGRARIHSSAVISDNAYISGKTVLMKKDPTATGPKVFGNARIFGNAQVLDSSEVFEFASVFGKAVLSENSRASSNSKIYGSAELLGNSEVTDQAEVHGTTKLSGEIIISGTAVVCDQIILNMGSVSSGAEHCNQIAEPILNISPNVFDFDGVAVGSSSAPHTFTITNNGGWARNCSNPLIGGNDTSDFTINFLAGTCGTSDLAPGDSCTVVVSSNPTTPEQKTASVERTCELGGTVSAVLKTNGLPPSLDIFPLLFDFGDVVIGKESSTQMFTISNNGLGNATGCSLPILEGSDADQFQIDSASNCGTFDVPASGSCDVLIKAIPTSPGTKAATLSRTCLIGGVVSSEFSVFIPEPIPNVTLVPQIKDYGTTVINNQSPIQTFTFTNIGTGQTGVCSGANLTGKNPSDFLIVADNCGSLDLGPQGGNCSVDVVGLPTSIGIKTATLTRTCLIGGTTRTVTNGLVQNATDSFAELAMSPLGLDYGMINVGSTSSTQTVTVTNTGNASATGCSAPTLSGADAGEFVIQGSGTCVGSDMGAGASCTIDVVSTPSSIGLKSANVNYACSFGGIVTSALSAEGIAPELAIAPTTHDFGDILVGTSSSATTLTISNSGTASATGCSAPALNGTNAADFQIQSDNCGVADLGVGGTCTVNVIASPQTKGIKVSDLSRTCTFGGVVTSSLSATGIGPELGISPASHDFGQVLVGSTSAAETFTFSNTGDSPASGCSSASVSGNTDFTVSGDTCGVSDLAPGATCTVSVTFTPSASATVAGDLVRSCTVGGMVSSNLTGTGIAPSLSLTPGTHDFGQVEAGEISTVQTFTVFNSGTADATGCSVPALSGSDAADFFIEPTTTCGTSDVITAGSCIIDVTARPGTIGLKAASLDFNCTVGGSHSSSLEAEGTGAILGMTPTSNDFGNIIVGQVSNVTTFTVSNTGLQAATGCTTPTLIGVHAGEFTIEASSTCGTVDVPASGSCTIDVVANPFSLGLKSATVDFACVNAESVQASVDVTGVAPLLGVSPDTFDFGNVLVSSSSAVQTFTFDNTGTADASGCSAATITGSDASDFVIQTDNCAMIDIAIGQSCTIDVTFTPLTWNSVKSATLQRNCAVGGVVSATLDGSSINPSMDAGDFIIAINTPVKPSGTFFRGFDEAVDTGRTLSKVIYDFGDGQFQEVEYDPVDGADAFHFYVFDGPSASYTVTKTIEDDLGAQVSMTKQITVTKGLSPHVRLSADNYVITAGNTVNFDASGTTDPDGKLITEYIVEFGDGDSSNETTSNFSHVYSTPGEYTITLFTIDEDRHLGTLTDTIKIFVDFAPPLEGFRPSAQYTTSDAYIFGSNILTVNYDASGSYDPDGTIEKTYFFSGDRNANPKWRVGTTGSFDYAHEASFHPIVINVDNDGNKSEQVFKNDIFTRGLFFQEADFFGFDAGINKIKLSALAYQGAAGDEFFLWELGDGNWKTGRIIEHEYAASGVKTVQLRIFDIAGNLQSKTKSFDVQPSNLSPELFIQRNQGENIILNGDISYTSVGTAGTDGSTPIIHWDNGHGIIQPQDSIQITFDTVWSTTITAWAEHEQPPLGNGFASKKSFEQFVFDVNPPSLSVIAPFTAYMDRLVNFDGSASLDDQPGEQYLWEINEAFGPKLLADIDPITDVYSGNIMDHEFLSSGVSFVRLYSTDSDGNTRRKTSQLNIIATEDPITVGEQHSCVKLETGVVRCWGTGTNGRLGYSSTDNVGNFGGTPILTAGDVPTGTVSPAIQVQTGKEHSCALFEDGTMRCWGSGNGGRLGYDAIADVGDSPGTSIDTTGSVPVVDGTTDTRKVTQIALGNSHTCALLEDGAVRCWGLNTLGQLGYGNTTSVGDSPATSIIAAGDVPLGFSALAISAGGSHTCAISTALELKCWGSNASGQLGAGNIDDIGDDEPASFGAFVSLEIVTTGTIRVYQVSAGEVHTCAVYVSHEFAEKAVKCWGSGLNGKLGQASTLTLGDDESVDSFARIDLGEETPNQISAGTEHTCVQTDKQNLICFGLNSNGELGYDSNLPVGDDETPGSVGTVPVNGRVMQVSAGTNNSCAQIINRFGDRYRCWGEGGYNGMDHDDNIGDGLSGRTIYNEGDVPVLVAKARTQTQTYKSYVLKPAAPKERNVRSRGFHKPSIVKNIFKSIINI